MYLYLIVARGVLYVYIVRFWRAAATVYQITRCTRTRYSRSFRSAKRKVITEWNEYTDIE
jgi:hypothetical protein